MLIKRIKNGSVIKALYESSNVVGSTYDLESKKLTVLFKSGVAYLYEEVSNTDYSKLELADSQGRVLNKHIKQHKTKSLGEVDIDEWKQEIADTKQSEIIMLNNNMMEVITRLAGFDTINEPMLEALIKLYNIRKEKIA